MELWLVMTGTFLLVAVSFVLGEHLQDKRERARQNGAEPLEQCVRFASECAGRLIWSGVLESGRRQKATEILAKAAYERSHCEADRAVEQKICDRVNELV